MPPTVVAAGIVAFPLIEQGEVNVTEMGTLAAALSTNTGTLKLVLP
jgi:hypothetical protein